MAVSGGELVQATHLSHDIVCSNMNDVMYLCEGGALYGGDWRGLGACHTVES